MRRPSIGRGWFGIGGLSILSPPSRRNPGSYQGRGTATILPNPDYVDPNVLGCAVARVEGALLRNASDPEVRVEVKAAAQAIDAAVSRIGQERFYGDQLYNQWEGSLLGMLSGRDVFGFDGLLSRISPGASYDPDTAGKLYAAFVTARESLGDRLFSSAYGAKHYMFNQNLAESSPTRRFGQPED